MSVEARRATGSGLRVTSESFAIATPAGDAERRCRRALLEAWVGRESAVLPAAAVVAGARPGRCGAARPRRPAHGPSADQCRRCRRTGDRGGAHRRQRLRPGAGLRPRRPGVAAGRLRPAGGRHPRPAAAPGRHARAPAARRGARRALAGTDRRLDQPGRGRLHARDDAQPAGADRPPGLAAPCRPDLAVRPRQRRDRRSRPWHARQRHRPRALRRRQRARDRGRTRRLGGAAGRRRRVDLARALPPVAAAARPARHRGRDRHPGAGRRARRRARRGAGAAAGD